MSNILKQTNHLPFQRVSQYVKMTCRSCSHALGVQDTPKGKRLFCPVCQFSLDPTDEVQVVRGEQVDMCTTTARDVLTKQIVG